MSKSAVWVAGGLEYENFNKIKRMLSSYPRGTVVMHGLARGADMLADQAAVELGHLRVRVPYHGPGGKSGGPIRNRLLGSLLSGLRSEGYEVSMLAFGGDRGTTDAIKVATSFGFDVKEIDR